MKRLCFHIDNFENTDANLLTLLAINYNTNILNNKSIVLYDNNYGSLKDLFSNHSESLTQSSDINSQLTFLKSRMLYKFENVKEGEKSILYNVTEVPLIIHNIQSSVYIKTKYNFNNCNNTISDHDEPFFIKVDEYITSASNRINSFGYLYDNKFIMIIHGNNTLKESESQKEDIYVNYVPNIIEDKILNVKKQLGLESDNKNTITRSQKPSYKFKLTCNWMSTDELYKNWSKMFTSGIVDLVHTTEDNYDFLVIINRPSCDYKPENSIVYRMEPYIETNKYYNDWNKYNKEQFMYFMEHKDFRNNTEWWISDARTFNIQKNCLLSAVISSQYDMDGHKFRVDFIKYLQKHSKYEVDTYGYSNKHNFKNYKGSLPERAKDSGLFPYKYTIAVENCDITNYFTEKIYDAIISECVCFYWGCNNAEEYINSQAFIRLDRDDLQKSLKIVEEAIANDEWSKRIEIIKKEKRKILNTFNIFTRTSSLIYINRHMKFFTNNEIPFIKNETLNISDIDMSIQDNVKYSEFILRNYDDSIVKIWEYSSIITHHNLWKQCASDNKDYCIIQGKAKSHFTDHLCTLLSIISHNNKEHDIIGLSDKMSNGYIISPSGARKLLNLINTYGMFTNLDNLLNDQNHGLTIVRSFKEIVDYYIPTSSLNLHLFKQIDGELNSTLELFKNRKLQTDTDNVMIVLDF